MSARGGWQAGMLAVLLSLWTAAPPALAQDTPAEAAPETAAETPAEPPAEADAATAAPAPDLPGAGRMPTPEEIAERLSSVLQRPVSPDADSPLLVPPTSVAPPLPLQVEDEVRDYAYGAFQRGWYLTALARATPRAEAGDAAAQTLLGVLYETGRGLPQDAELAASWYQLAANNGDTRAALRYGLMLLNGLGVAQDKVKAGDMFEIAANAGIPEAIYNLAGLYRTGEGRPLDPDRALELLEKAADLDDVDARFQLADRKSVV